MERYKEERQKDEKTSRIVGLATTVLVHLVLVIFGVVEGVKYLSPPPPEATFLIDFTQQPNEPTPPTETAQGRQPQSTQIDKQQPVELVQKSQSPIKGLKENKAPESVVDEKGDVEVKQHRRTQEIKRKALFPSANNTTDKDTLAPQTASKVRDALKAGHASGNTDKGNTTGTPNAHLKGRTVVGSLPKPVYSAQQEGKVVVKIWVDQYGTVQKAVAGDAGTTVVDKQLWAEARNAALKAHFNMSANAPALQEGTITYIFKLK